MGAAEMDEELAATVEDSHGTNGSVIMKVDLVKNKVFLDGYYKGLSLDGVKGKVPAGQPRLILYYYQCKYVCPCLLFVEPPGYDLRERMSYTACIEPLAEAVGSQKTFMFEKVEDITEEQFAKAFAE
ncbi:glia maturation factor-like [Nerophis lumbriciformis]|uniref:glia maturation factor-like n=1 Tax=Nerophis lumbriciformis TaxID=546530 RepID=UPI002ADFB353|nr:glia maturation factor beta-like [Nerophis lumbriciformis]